MRTGLDGERRSFAHHRVDFDVDRVELGPLERELELQPRAAGSRKADRRGFARASIARAGGDVNVAEDEPGARGVPVDDRPRELALPDVREPGYPTDWGARRPVEEAAREHLREAPINVEAQLRARAPRAAVVRATGQWDNPAGAVLPRRIRGRRDALPERAPRAPPGVQPA